MILLDIILYAFVAVLGAAVFALFAAGVYAIAGGTFIVPIPAMPDIVRIFPGASLLALSLLAVIGTIYYTLFVTQYDASEGCFARNLKITCGWRCSFPTPVRGAAPIVPRFGGPGPAGRRRSLYPFL
jgi:hypothetical protein